jgi:hypothetical protein
MTAKADTGLLAIHNEIRDVIEHLQKWADDGHIEYATAYGRGALMLGGTDTADDLRKIAADLRWVADMLPLNYEEADQMTDDMPEIGSVAELRQLARQLGVDPDRLLGLPCARKARDELLNGVTSRTYAEVLRAAAASAADPEKVRAIAEQLIAADAADHAEVDYDGEPF